MTDATTEKYRIKRYKVFLRDSATDGVFITADEIEGNLQPQLGSGSSAQASAGDVIIFKLRHAEVARLARSYVLGWTVDNVGRLADEA